MNSENIDSLLEAVDIKLFERVNECRWNVWNQQVDKILNGQPSQKLGKISDIIKLTNPPKEWQWDSQKIDQLKEFIKAQQTWYLEKAEETKGDKESFKKILEEHLIEFDDLSFAVKEERRPKRQREDEKSDKDPNYKRAKKGESLTLEK